MWPRPPQFPLCRNCRKPGKGSQETDGDDWSVDSRKYITDFLPFKVATSTSEPGLRTTWSFLRLLIFGTWGPKHFLCHPFLTKLSVISPWCQLEDWHRRSGDWWHQTMPISVISEILTQLHNVPAAAPPLASCIQGQMLTSGQWPCCDWCGG